MRTQRDTLAAEVERLQVDRDRAEIEAAERLDELAAQVTALQEQLERAELARDLNGST